jgi:multidrug efflux system membrane fusion protein
LAVIAVILVVGSIWYARHAATTAQEAADSGAPKSDGNAPGAKGQAPADDKGSRRGAGAGGRGADPIPVAVATATKQDIRVTQNALGTVTPMTTVTIQAQVSGQLVNVAFTEGQTVHKGDVLVQIDPRPYAAALAQAEGQLAKDQAALEEARMDMKRYDDLMAKKSIMRQQAEDQKWVVLQDEGAVRVDQAQVDAARVNLGYCTIVSPIDGRVGLRLVDPGNIVQTGSSGANLAVVTRMQPMTVVFALPEDDLPKVLARQRAGVRLPVQVFDRSGAHLLDSGFLLAVDSQINTSTGTVNLKAQFPNASGTLFPNQFVNAVLEIDVLKDAVAVPTAALQQGAKGSFVYAVKADNTVAMTPVKTGPSDGSVIAALSGLNAGDRVVIDGADKLRDGAAVSIPTGK